MTVATEVPEFALEIKATIIGVEPDAEVILFGSRARGDHKLNSDWDILVVTKEAKNSRLKHQIRDRLADFLLEDDALVSVLFIEKNIWNQGRTPSPVISEVRKDGMLL